MSLITVLGSSGFIGSHLVRRLRERELRHLCPARSELPGKENLGHIIYCIGLTADFRSRPFDTVEAHVCLLLRILRECSFDSLTYLSSARLYGRNKGIAREEDAIQIRPQDPDDLYNISKAMGESLCFAAGRNIRVVRVSNVYGADFSSDNFLPAVIREAVSEGNVTLHTSLQSEKDYVSIDDVTDMLPRIALEGSQRIYNLASGKNVSNSLLMGKIASLTGCTVVVSPQAETIMFPSLSIQRLEDEFSYTPSDLLADIEKLLPSYELYRGRSK
jgi:nucleoside-diphosphate-sugar epimerase